MIKKITKKEEIENIKSARKRLENQLVNLGGTTDKDKILSMLTDKQIGIEAENENLVGEDEKFGAMVFAGIVRNRIYKLN